jgi:hypothetical protein
VNTEVTVKCEICGKSTLKRLSHDKQECERILHKREALLKEELGKVQEALRGVSGVSGPSIVP